MKVQLHVENMVCSKMESSGLVCIGFDGRKDDTRIAAGIVKEPSIVYMDHATPNNWLSKAISDETTQLQENFMGLVCDGTPYQYKSCWHNKTYIVVYRTTNAIVCIFHLTDKLNELPAV